MHNRSKRWLKRIIVLGSLVGVVALVYYLPLIISLSRPAVVQAVPAWQPHLAVQAQSALPNQFVYPRLGISAPLTEEPGVSPWNQKDWAALEDDLHQSVALTYQSGEGFAQAPAAQVIGHSSGNYGAYSYIFAPLGQARIGDSLVLEVDDHQYTYTVVSKEVVLPNLVPDDQSLINGKPRLTLVCCWPLETTARRLVVTASLTKVE